MCTKCTKFSNKQDLKSWLNTSCSGASVSPLPEQPSMGSSGEQITELPVVVSQARRKRNQANTSARRFNKSHVVAVEGAVLAGIPAKHHEAV